MQILLEDKDPFDKANKMVTFQWKFEDWFNMQIKQRVDVGPNLSHWLYLSLQACLLMFD